MLFFHLFLPALLDAVKRTYDELLVVFVKYHDHHGHFLYSNFTTSGITRYAVTSVFAFV